MQQVEFKRSCFLLLVFLGSISTGSAQGFFAQNSAWIKNQIKQIALWEIYIKDLEKGYQIAKEGLNTISDIKNGEWHLHIDHFGSLMDVNPVVKKYSKAIEIVLMQLDIKRLVSHTDDDYIKTVWTNLVNKSDEDVEQLNRVLSPGNYQLTDDERIGQIDKLYVSMKDKYAFAKSFASDVKIMSLQQLKELNEVKTSKLLNNLQP